MISWVHLLWIVPVSVLAGFFMAALMCAANSRDDFKDVWPDE